MMGSCHGQETRVRARKFTQHWKSAYRQTGERK